MGFGPFEGSTKTYVNVSVQRVIPDAQLPNPAKTGILKGLYQQGDMVDFMLEEVSTSIGVKSSRYFNYGKTKYVFGCPSATVVTKLTAINAIASYLNSTYGAGVTLSYAKYGALNYIHYGWVTLIANYGYNPTTNALANLSASVGYPVYLTSAVPVVSSITAGDSSNGSLASWGQAATQFEEVPGLVQDYLRVSYLWHVPVTVMVEGVSTVQQEMYTGSFNIDLPDPFLLAQQYYCMAKYQIGGVDNYFNYVAGSGLHPTLDSLYDVAYDDLGSFFPNIYFRIGGRGLTSAEITSATKLAKYIGIGYDELAGPINSNPDIGSVAQAMVSMVVPAVSTNQAEQRYLFDFFKALSYKTAAMGVPEVFQGSYDPGGEGGMGGYSWYYTQPSLIIQDAGLKQVLGYQYLTRTVVAGTIGAVDTYTAVFGNKTTSYVVPETYTYDEVGITSIVPATTAYVDTPQYIYRHQITANVYEEIGVVGMHYSYWVWGYYRVLIQGGNNFFNKGVALMVPLDKSITDNYPLKVKNELFYRSLHFVATTHQEVETAWYEGGAFAQILTLGAVVLTVMSFGSDGGFFQQLIAGTLTVAQAVNTVLIGILKAAAWTLATKLFIQIVGVKLAFLVAIVSAVVAGYKTYQAGSIKGAPWAENLLLLSNNLVKNINLELKSSMDSLQNDMAQFKQASDKKMEELHDKQKLLDGDSAMSPRILWGETPEDFFARTIHYGNIGIAGIDAIGEYVTVALKLPELSDQSQFA